MKESIPACVAILLVSLVAVGQGKDLSGTWMGTAFMSDGSEDRITLVLTKEDQTFSGTFTDTAGHAPEGTPVADFKVTDDEITFSFVTAEGIRITAWLSVAGESMKGHWDSSKGDVAGLELTRRKA